MALENNEKDPWRYHLVLIRSISTLTKVQSKMTQRKNELRLWPRESIRALVGELMQVSKKMDDQLTNDGSAKADTVMETVIDRYFMIRGKLDDFQHNDFQIRANSSCYEMPRRHERLLSCPIQFACLCTAKDKNAGYCFWHQINFKYFQFSLNLTLNFSEKMLEISKESVIQTLLDHGGRMPQKQLSSIYKPLLADKTQRPLFQKIVNQVAFVKTKEENGEAIKVVFLKKELRSRFVSYFSQ